MDRELHFEQLFKRPKSLLHARLGRAARNLYADTLHHALMWFNNRRIFVATEDHALRAVTSLEIRTNPQYANLLGIAVDSEHRREGIGRFVMENLFQYAASQHCSYMQVVPVVDCERFYERLGFEQRSENSMYWIRKL